MTIIVTTTAALRECEAGATGNSAADRVLAHPHTCTLNRRRERMLAEAAGAWERRTDALELRKGTKGRAAQAEAFLQGILAVMTSGGYMTHDEAAMVGFMVSVGRAEEVIARWAE